MNNHTAGPWIESDNCSGMITVKTESGETIAAIGHDNGNNRANARLIAAAPDLLRVIQQAHRLLRKSDYDMTEINAVIAKAKGV